MSSLRTVLIVAMTVVISGVLFLATERPLSSSQRGVIPPQEELRQLNEVIEEAENLRDRYLAEAARAEDQGMRWQFMQNQQQEAKRAFQRADEKRKDAKVLQEKIDLLNSRRELLLKENPELNVSDQSP